MAEIQKVKYTHDGMIDLIVANPSLAQGEIAAVFGYTQTWISIIFNSDAFKERLEERKSELVDPVIRATIEEKFKALASLSMEIVLEKLHATRSEHTALKALDISARALGYGSKVGGQAPVSVHFHPVAVVPAKELNSDAWRTSFSPHRAAQRAVDVEFSEEPGPV
jgi:hypothetical protein